MTLCYRYKKEKGSIYRPKIPVRLSYKNRLLDVLAVIDSGSDKIYIPYGIARHLRLIMRGHTYEVGTAGGSRNVKDSRLNITLGMDDEQYTFRGVQVQVPIMEDKRAEVLLGRMGFFDKFHITFKEDTKEVILERISK